MKLLLSGIFLLVSQAAAIQGSAQHAAKAAPGADEQKALQRLWQHAQELRELKHEFAKLKDKKAKASRTSSEKVVSSKLDTLMRKESSETLSRAMAQVDSIGKLQLQRKVKSSQLPATPLQKVDNKTLVARQKILKDFASLVEYAKKKALKVKTKAEREQLLVNLFGNAQQERKRLKALGVKEFARLKIPQKSFQDANRTKQALGQTQIQKGGQSQRRSHPHPHPTPTPTPTPGGTPTPAPTPSTTTTVTEYQPCTAGYQYDTGIPCREDNSHFCGPGTGDLGAFTYDQLKVEYPQFFTSNAGIPANMSFNTSHTRDACQHDCETSAGCVAFTCETSKCLLWSGTALPITKNVHGEGSMVYNRTDVSAFTCYKVGLWSTEQVPAIQTTACVPRDPASEAGKLCFDLGQKCRRHSTFCEPVDAAQGAEDAADFAVNQAVQLAIQIAIQQPTPDVINNVGVYHATNHAIEQIARAVQVAEDEAGLGALHKECPACQGGEGEGHGGGHGHGEGEEAHVEEHELPTAVLPFGFPQGMDPALAQWVEHVGITGTTYMRMHPLDRLKVAAKLENDVSNFEAWKFGLEHPGADPPDYVMIHNVHNEVHHHTHTETNTHHEVHVTEHNHFGHAGGEGHHTHHAHEPTFTHSENETPEEKRFEGLKVQCEDASIGAAMISTSPDDIKAIVSDLCQKKLFIVMKDQLVAYGHKPSPEEITHMEEKAEEACIEAETVLAQHSGSSEVLPAKLEELFSGGEGVPGFCDKLAEALNEESATNPTPASGKKGCFPEDATVVVKGADGLQQTPLRDLLPGDFVAVGSIKSGDVFFSPVLTELHTDEEHDREGVEYLMLQHNHGTLHITANHFVATKSRGFVPAGEVKIGEEIIISAKDGGSLVPTKVISRTWVSKRGMYAPLTWEGCLIVDGVLASSYITPPEGWLSKKALQRFSVAMGGWDGLHSVEHLLMLPVRLAHKFGIAATLSALAAWGFPGAASAVRFFSADPLNLAQSNGAWGVPGYIDFTGKITGGIIETLF